MCIMQYAWVSHHLTRLRYNYSLPPSLPLSPSLSPDYDYSPQSSISSSTANGGQTTTSSDDDDEVYSYVMNREDWLTTGERLLLSTTMLMSGYTTDSHGRQLALR